MARDLTIQIRLTEQEHATIAAQAEKEGLGVGTYLRALALRTALATSQASRGRAVAALRRSQERAKARGVDRLSSKDIESEIKSARTARRSR